MEGKALNRRAMLGGVATAIGFGSIGTASADVIRTVRLHDTVRGSVHDRDFYVRYTVDARLQIQYTDEEHNNERDENEKKIYVKGSLTGSGSMLDGQEYRVQANINDEAFVYKGYNSLITGVDLDFIPVPKRGQEIRTEREVIRLDPPYDPDEISMSSYII